MRSATAPLTPKAAAHNNTLQPQPQPQPSLSPKRVDTQFMRNHPSQCKLYDVSLLITSTFLVILLMITYLPVSTAASIEKPGYLARHQLLDNEDIK